jgi:hypothetical protein
MRERGLEVEGPQKAATGPACTAGAGGVAFPVELEWRREAGDFLVTG